MANKINVKLILQLRDAGLSRNSIASTRHMSRHSVSDVLHIADQKGLSYADVRGLDDNQVYRMFYPNKHSEETMYRDPDYEYVRQELRKVGVTLKFLCEEYKDKCESENAIPMGYTKYFDGYREYTAENRLTNHLQHKPDDAAEVDWSGPTMHYVDTSAVLPSVSSCRQRRKRSRRTSLIRMQITVRTRVATIFREKMRIRKKTLNLKTIKQCGQPLFEAVHIRKSDKSLQIE